jgi:hypothetical protein
MLSIVFAVLGVIFTLYGAFGIHRSNKKLKEVRKQQKAIEPSKKIETPKDYVKIGTVDKNFNKDLHECRLPKIGPYGDETQGWEIGTVIACNVSECGQEWVLGYYQETVDEMEARHERTLKAYDSRQYTYTRTYSLGNGQSYIDDFNPITPEEVKKKWYTMAQYEKSPDKYVYYT